jgi:arylsulfatase
MPTLVAAAGEPDVVDKLKAGYTANGKEWRIHPDGYNFLPYFKGEAEQAPRKEMLYFGQGGELNAVRYQDWKINFAGVYGNIATGERRTTSWPMIVNLKADPYEQMPFEAEMGYLRWYAENMWLFVPVQQVVKEFFSTIKDYPIQLGSTLNAASIGYNTLQEAQALERLNQLETFMPAPRQ